MTIFRLRNASVEPALDERVSFARPDIGEAEIAAVVECLRSGWLTAGRRVAAFEARFAEQVGARHAVSFNSATAAALVLMEVLGVAAGSEVIVPTWTFSGPAMMAHKLGARVVLADVEEASFNLSARTTAPLLNDRTAVVMPTHFAGLSCDMTGLAELCATAGIDLLDDAAHAFPSQAADGRRVGSQGAAATFFSFYATKPLTTGEGGMVVTDSIDLDRRLRARRCHGLSRDAWQRGHGQTRDSWSYEVVEPGWKANMTDLDAALGLVQLARSAALLAARERVAAGYHAAFAAAEAAGRLVRPSPQAGQSHHLYPLRVMGDRDDFIRGMAALGIDCSVHFIPLHKHRFWRDAAVNGRADFPVADLLHGQEVSLPIASWMTEADIDRVIHAVLQIAPR